MAVRYVEYRPGGVEELSAVQLLLRRVHTLLTGRPLVYATYHKNGRGRWRVVGVTRVGRIGACS